MLTEVAAWPPVYCSSRRAPDTLPAATTAKAVSSTPTGRCVRIVASELTAGLIAGYVAEHARPTLAQATYSRLIRNVRRNLLFSPVLLAAAPA